MDQKSQEYLQSILQKNPRDLNQNEILFLKARRSYVKDSQLEEFKSVLFIEESKDNQTSDEEKPNPVIQDGKNNEKESNK